MKINVQKVGNVQNEEMKALMDSAGVWVNLFLKDSLKLVELYSSQNGLPERG